MDNSLLHNITVTRQDNDITGSTSLPKDSISSGTYTIEVYDEYTNGLILPNIAYSTTITITVPTSTDSVDMSSVTDSSTPMSPTVDATPRDPVPPDSTILVVVGVSIAILIIIMISIISVIIIVKCKFLDYEKKKVDSKSNSNLHENNQQRNVIPLSPVAEPVAVHDAVIHTSTNPCYDDVILSSPNVTPNDAYGVIYIKT
jgi:hypothetical protein